MKLGVMPFVKAGMSDPDWAAEFAVAVEATEAESIWNYEHVALPDTYESVYPYGSSGKMTSSQLDEDRPDPLLWLQHIAAHTSRVRLGTGLMVLPLHNPLILAKRIATLDQLSKGRVIAGFGIGWLAEEYEALAVPFPERGSRANEYLQIMRSAWAPGTATFSGRHHTFTQLHMNPKPAQAGGVPIIIGGHSRAAMRRAARFGNGVFLIGQSPESLKALLAMLYEEADVVGRPKDDFEITVDAPLDPESAMAYRDLGVHRLLRAIPTDDVVALSDTLRRYIADVLPR
jgi:probable F420-dependent oxidoreductase